LKLLPKHFDKKGSRTVSTDFQNICDVFNVHQNKRWYINYSYCGSFAIVLFLEREIPCPVWGKEI